MFILIKKLQINAVSIQFCAIIIDIDDFLGYTTPASIYQKIFF